MMELRACMADEEEEVKEDNVERELDKCRGGFRHLELEVEFLIVILNSDLKDTQIVGKSVGNCLVVS
jgi:hypothetical protein